MKNTFTHAFGTFETEPEDLRRQRAINARRADALAALRLWVEAEREQESSIGGFNGQKEKDRII